MNFNEFTRLYPVSKTLRFELRPVGKTKENIEKNGFLIRDQIRAKDYIRIKAIIDEYHKAYIDEVLSRCVLQYDNVGKHNSLTEYVELVQRAGLDGRNKDTLKKVQTNLRKQIVSSFKHDQRHKYLFKKELIKDYLYDFVQTEEDRRLVDSFKSFTTYFTGFNQNRENMYSDEDKSTAIGYRLIHDNLPKFIDNIKAFHQIAEEEGLSESLQSVYAEACTCGDVESLTDVFRLEYFNNVLTQKGITCYNGIVGELNKAVNLYNQQHRDARLPKLKMLYKQILSDREPQSWLPEQFDNDDEVLRSIGEYHESMRAYLSNLKILLESIADYDLSGIFVRNDEQMTEISKRISGDWSTIQRAVVSDLKSVRKQKRSEDAETYEAELRKLYAKQGSLSIEYIDSVSGLAIESYFSNLGAVDTESRQEENLFAKIENAYAGVEKLLKEPYPHGKKLIGAKDDVALLKDLLDAWKELQRFVKPLLGVGDEADKDMRFYGELLPISDRLAKLTPLYNMVRNYVTRKPYSTAKFKLNFDSSQLLGGWDRNKECACLSVILRRGGNYYLAIIDKNHNRIFDGERLPCDGECYEKMVYKQISISAGVGGFFRKCYGTAMQYGWNCPDSCLNDEGKIIIRDDEVRGNLIEIIDCQKDFLNKYEKDGFKYRDYGFRFAASSDYEKLSDFYRDINEQRYKLSFTPVSAAYIDSLVEESKLYLFQIYNKDFSEHSKGTPNMHTLYWKMLFDERNLTDVVYQLNGGAELFYRERSIERTKPTHESNVPIKNKNRLNKKKESTFAYDLTKDKRYTVDKFQFHVPITLNFKSEGRDDINSKVRDYLHSADDVHVIGIDRGERNLLYLTVVDKHGRICEQLSLNEICNSYGGNDYKTDYHALLDKREHDRLRERQSWQTIEGIKELKEGYLSQVIHKIAELMVKYRAIVVLEDLNRGFMRGRQKVEKSVYQKFEKMLIDKLNYLVDKKADPELPGGLLKAYQLTSKFSSFAKQGKQSGFLFYVPAWNTSKIDPVTGFVNLFDLRYESKDKAKALLCKFDTIRYNADRDRFEFSFDYDRFTSKAEGTRTVWTVCTHGTRIETFRNQEKNSEWDCREVDLTAEMNRLFEEYGIDITGNLKNAIAEQGDKAFFEQLLRLLRLTLQMRNSNSKENVDYIISPVADADGRFFDSRDVDDSMPKDADANGAYNIARKGLMIIEQIKCADDVATVRFDLSNKNWLRYAQHSY